MCSHPIFNRAALVAASLFLAACGGSTLTGSVVSSSDLSFDYVEAELVSGELVVRYLSNDVDPVPREPVRLSMDSAVSTGTEIPAVPNLRLSHYLVVRAPGGDLVEAPPFPDLDHGHILFNSVGTTSGHAVAGNFSLVFVDGSNLEGTFSTSLTTP